MTAAIQNATPSFVVCLGTTYYAGIGTLWNKTDDAETWSIATVPVSPDGTVFASSGAVINVSGTDTLFVAFSYSTGSSLGIWSTINGADWIQVDAAFPATGYLRTLLAANDLLFAVTATSALVDTVLTEFYSIYYFDGTSFVTAGITDDSTIGMPSSVAYDNSAYWFTAGDKILTGVSPGSLSEATEPTDGSRYAGVCAAGTDIIISSRSGFLYHYNGTSWTNSYVFASSASKAYSLSTPTYFELDTAKTLLVGTNKISLASVTPPAYGYLEFDLSSSFTADIQQKSGDTALSTAINFASSLSGISVNAMPFFDSGATKKVFALTDGDGLWSNTYEDDPDTATTDLVWGGWVRE